MKLSRKLGIFLKYLLPRPSRIYNLIMLYLSKSLRLTRLLNKPITAMIEPTNYCNLHCPLCPTGAGLIKRKPENLSFEDFKKILDNLGSSIIHVRLWNWGEPFLNKDFSKMVRYAKSKKIFVNTSTNSSFLNEKIMVELIDSGLDQLIVSLDGASEETYNKYRKNGDFKKVVLSLKKISEIKKSRGINYPEVKLQFIVMRHNEHEISEVIKLAKFTGVNTVFFKTVGIMDPELKKDIEKYIPQNKKFRRYFSMENELKSPKLSSGICNYLWEEATVNVDGSMVSCCRDAHGKYVFGNLKEQNISKIWNSPKMVNFRKTILNNKNRIDICQSCSGSNKEFVIKEVKIN